MSYLASLLLINALTASGMALMVFAFCKIPAIRCRPAIQHVLWFCVLFKLMAPPIFELSILPPSSVAPEVAVRNEPPKENSQTWTTTTEVNRADKNSSIVNKLKEPASQINWTTALILISFFGSGIMLAYFIRQISRTNAVLRFAELDNHTLSSLTRDIGFELGLVHVPKVAIVCAHVSPCLWMFSKHTKLIIPKSLITQLNCVQLRSVIAHELAHFKRRDDWSNVVSLAVLTLFWWNPLAWIARRQILIAQESCCDAMVLNCKVSRPKAYANALFNVLEYLSLNRADLTDSLAIASGFDSASQAKRRISMIANPNLNHRLSWWSCAIILAAVAALPCLPSSASAQEVELKECPEAVQKAFRAEAGDGRIIEVEKEKLDGKTVYEAEVVNGTNIFDVVVTESGLLLSKTFERPKGQKEDDEDEGEDEDEEGDDDDDGDDEGDDDDKDDDENEEESVAMKVDDLPAAVKATLLREAKNGEIEDLEKETENGKVIYSADVEYETDRGELEYEIEISADGTLLHKILEDIEEDDDDDDGDDEGDDDDDDDDDN